MTNTLSLATEAPTKMAKEIKVYVIQWNLCIRSFNERIHFRLISLSSSFVFLLRLCFSKNICYPYLGSSDVSALRYILMSSTPISCKTYYRIMFIFPHHFLKNLKKFFSHSVVCLMFCRKWNLNPFIELIFTFVHFTLKSWKIHVRKIELSKNKSYTARIESVTKHHCTNNIKSSIF